MLCSIVETLGHLSDLYSVRTEGVALCCRVFRARQVVAESRHLVKQSESRSSHNGGAKFKRLRFRSFDTSCKISSEMSKKKNLTGRRKQTSRENRSRSRLKFQILTAL